MAGKQQQPPRRRPAQTQQPTSQTQQPRVVRNAAASRYELYVEDALAGTIEYRSGARRLILASTVIEPTFAGQGLGSHLVAGALDDARARGEQVVPECDFVAAYIERHPSYQNMIATD